MLLAALWSPMITEAVRSGADASTALIAFGLLQFWRAQPIVIVALGAAAGHWLLS